MTFRRQRRARRVASEPIRPAAGAGGGPRGGRGLGRVAALSVIGAALGLCASAPPAGAQVSADDGFAPTRGVFIPGRTVAGDADGTAVELNPGQLAQLADTSLVLVGNQSSRH